MRAFQSNKRLAASRIAQVLLIAWIVFGPATAPGQELGPPIPLIPPPSPALDVSPDLSPPLSIRESPVGSEPLAPSSPQWSAGMVSPRNALPAAFWRGTTRVMAGLLLARLPNTVSPVLQSLARRLLLSPGSAPEGSDDSDPPLQVLRIRSLLRLGELEPARAVIAALPERERGPALPLTVAADAIDGDVERACATVRETIRNDQGEFWQTALISCQALQGETEQASVGLQLVAEEQGPRNEALALAVEALAGRPSPTEITQLEVIDPLTLRLLVAARLILRPTAIDVLSPDLSLSLALDEQAPAAIRLAAAERAAQFGALPLDRLRALYLDKANAGELRGEPTLEHARLFAAIGNMRSAAERLERVVSFAGAFGAPQTSGFTLAARLVAPALREIVPDATLAGSAPIVARLLIAAGENAAARQWSPLVAEAEAGSPRLLIALATGREELSPIQAEASRNPFFVALSSALGQPVSAADWVRLPAAAWAGAAPPSPAPAAWLALVEAAREKRIGETVLASILVAAPTGTLSTDPVALFAAVSGLRQVGLEADARRLAVEAALAAGL